MTPTQFIESRRVEGGLMGGVFVSSLADWLLAPVPPYNQKWGIGQYRRPAEMFEEWVKNTITDYRLTKLWEAEDEAMANGDGTWGFEGISQAIKALNDKPFCEPSAVCIHPDDYDVCVREAKRRGVSVDVVLSQIFGVPR